MRKSALYAFGLVVTALVALGLVILSSASEANAMRLHHGDAYFFMKRQFVYLVGGIAIAAGVAAIDYRRWRDYPFLAYAFAAVVFVLLWGVFLFRPVNGSYRWLMFGPLRLQPSEFAKLATVIAVAVWLDRASWRVELFTRGALWPYAIIGAMCVPIVREPDFGSVMVVGLAGTLVMFVAGVRFWHMVPFWIVGGGAVAAKIALNENRMRRLMSFFSSASQTAEQVAAIATDKMDAASYQAHMALVAIRNGGLWGVGLGNSMQKQFYLPEAHTDFIFAVGAEELGLLFSIVTVLLFVLFFALAVYIAIKASDRFGRLLVVGMAFLIFFQAMFNLGVVCEALPTKGMALPFFSYGGTNLLSAFFAVGTILSVGIHSYRDEKRVIKRSVFV